MTICAFKENYVKCQRKAVSSYRGKPYCNKHLQELRKREFDSIDFEKAEQKFGGQGVSERKEINHNVHKGGSS